ncbi:class I SAM-dependent methyltransferase [Wielerella bovis]|uniref:class I SAM-dependent methyltransferase n=1 Tax=Wielerella bovis TaxID=2917790 RepID=UPI002019B4F6|nr:SAM-dependent methyltransferase [Wielerella bovis]MCG7657615.1 SAM-dependent methyltransferase [Wielerella bovis]MCG7659836.1 SAM-dependent methyltransferase [Wielerella bovis]
MTFAQIPHISPDAEAASQALTDYIAADIHAHDGAIPFSRFMQHALYAPQLGYYTGGAHKIGAAGDFITAPTLSPLFGQTLARQIALILPQTAGNVYEFGAGTGALATQIINALSGSLKNYYIIELSPDLAARQREYIAQNAADFAERVIWLDTLPEQLDGVLIGNEVLDAMPIERVRRNEHGELEWAYVGINEQHELCFQYKPLQDTPLFQAACEYFPDTPNYTSELHPTQHAFIRTLAQKLTRGAMIWLDYGFDAAQYYHPQRNDGTLIGHHRHHTIHDPFYRVGLTDLTAHINFSDIAAAGCGAGLDLIGYTTQANFLFNLGILDLLAQQYPQTDTADYVQAAHAVQVLTAQHEMGELFKVIAFGREVDVDWLGFAYGDLCHKL